MAKKTIPFPPAAEPEAIVKHRREIVIRLGTKRYAIDITTSARSLPPEPAKVKVFPRNGISAATHAETELATDVGRYHGASLGEPQPM